MTTKALIPGELVIAVDFDGTISTDPNMALRRNLTIQPHCHRVLCRLHDSGAKLILWTCRSGRVLEEAIDFLVVTDLYRLFTTINDQLPEIVEKYSPNVSRKVGADVYIDDKNLGTTINWLEIEKAIFGEE